MKTLIIPQDYANINKYKRYKQNCNTLVSSHLIIRKIVAAKQAKSKLQAGKESSDKAGGINLEALQSWYKVCSV